MHQYPCSCTGKWHSYRRVVKVVPTQISHIPSSLVTDTAILQHLYLPQHWCVPQHSPLAAYLPVDICISTAISLLYLPGCLCGYWHSSSKVLLPSCGYWHGIYAPILPPWIPVWALLHVICNIPTSPKTGVMP